MWATFKVLQNENYSEVRGLKRPSNTIIITGWWLTTITLYYRLAQTTWYLSLKHITSRDISLSVLYVCLYFSLIWAKVAYTDFTKRRASQTRYKFGATYVSVFLFPSRFKKWAVLGLIRSCRQTPWPILITFGFLGYLFKTL